MEKYINYFNKILNMEYFINDIIINKKKNGEYMKFKQKKMNIN